MTPRPDDWPACSDCKHFDGGGDCGDLCQHPKCSTFDIVRGREPGHARNAREAGVCGIDGKFFALRSKPAKSERLPCIAIFITLLILATLIGSYVSGVILQ